MNDHRAARRAPLDISPKVTIAALGAAVAAIVIYVIEATAGVDIPTTVEAATAVVVTFAAGYLTPDR